MRVPTIRPEPPSMPVQPVFETARPAVTAIAMPAVEPGFARRTAHVPEGATIAEIVGQVLPGLTLNEMGAVRVTLVTASASAVVDPAVWRRVRPRAGVTVVVRVVPQKGVLRQILMILVLVIAVVLGNILGPIIAGATGGLLSAGTATALATGAIAAAGQLLVNMLIGPTDPEKEKQRFSITGLRNRANPDGVIPFPMGRLRVAPIYAAPPYAEIVGDQQFIRAVFLFGYGRMEISDHKIGDTPLDEFDEVEIEVREGVEGDDPISLYPQQVIEEQLSAELTRAWEREDDGDYVEGGTTIEKPIVRYSAADATEACVVIGFPGGLTKFDDEGDRQDRSVEIRIRQRPIGTASWSTLTTLKITSATAEPLWRAHRWTFPSRGAYEIELTRMTNESKSSRVSDRCVWVALQSFRPEYPINFDKPLCLVGLRIKASYQLNGSLDAYTAIAERLLPDWDATAEAWITRKTRSPAAAFRAVLQGAASAYPVADAGLDLAALADWAEFCADKGLKYDFDHAGEGSLWDALTQIAGAGRAAPRHDGVRWSVVIDRPDDVIVDHLSPRNSRDFRWRRTYFKAPDGVRVSFIDETANWAKRERIIPWPGHVGDIVVTEDWPRPGKTDPDEIWIETRRRMYELIHRPDQYEMTQDGLLHVATRGDEVTASVPVLEETHMVGRVKRVTGRLVEVDEVLTIEAGTDYGCRFRTFAGAEDVVGTSVVAAIAAVTGETRSFTLASGPAPAVGSIVHLGPLGAETWRFKVRAEERGDQAARILHMIASAPIIDTLTDAEVPPAWDGRVGSTIGSSSTEPDPPRFVRIATGVKGTDDPDGLVVSLSPAVDEIATIGAYEIDHRLSGAPSWTTLTVTAAAGGGEITGYSAGDAVDLLARAISIYGIESADGPAVTVAIGEDDVLTPAVETFNVVRLSSGRRRFTFELADGADGSLVLGYRLRSRPAGSWVWSDLEPLHTGLVGGSPWETDQPLTSGSQVFGVAAVGTDGLESTPKLITRTIGAPYGEDVLVQRIERALGWPGTKTGATVSAKSLVGGTSLPSSFVYLFVEDLGADADIDVAVTGYGIDGSETVTMRVGSSADGAPVGTGEPPGTKTGVRYVEIRLEVSNSSARARIEDLVTIIKGGA